MMDKKILIIEDEEDILALIHYNLTKDGFKVYCAASGEEGLKKVSEQNPDMILLDLMLPGVSGIEICRILKQVPIPAMASCRTCQKTFEPEADNFLCPECGQGLVNILQGDEFILNSLTCNS